MNENWNGPESPSRKPQGNFCEWNLTQGKWSRQKAHVRQRIWVFASCHSRKWCVCFFWSFCFSDFTSASPGSFRHLLILIKYSGVSAQSCHIQTVFYLSIPSHQSDPFKWFSMCNCAEIGFPQACFHVHPTPRKIWCFPCARPQ